MASTRRASLNGGLGAEHPAGSPQRGPGAEPLVGVRLRPPEAESFLYIVIQKSGQKLRI